MARPVTDSVEDAVTPQGGEGYKYIKREVSQHGMYLSV